MKATEIREKLDEYSRKWLELQKDRKIFFKKKNDYEITIQIKRRAPSPTKDNNIERNTIYEIEWWIELISEILRNYSMEFWQIQEIEVITKEVDENS
jgi:hypothetical protein